MTDTVAFRAALGRIGFNPATADGIAGQGHDSIDSLTTLTGGKDIDTLDKPMMNGCLVACATGSGCCRGRCCASSGESHDAIPLGAESQDYAILLKAIRYVAAASILVPKLSFTTEIRFLMISTEPQIL
jgi:hypothetical protein